VHATDPGLSDLRARYNAFVKERNALQEKKAECELVFKQIVLDVSLFTDEQITQYREQYLAVTKRIDAIVHEIDELLKAGTLRKQLEREFAVRIQNETAADGEQKSTLTLTKLNDLLNEPAEQIDWLVDKMLPAGGFSLLVAKPKAGKSTLARNLALAVAQGKDFFGKPIQQGPVIYLALEEKRAEVRKHFLDMGATGGEEIYIFAASAPVDALQQIRTVAEEKKPALIIIDPLFKLTRIKDGNDYAQVTQALEPLLVLARETGAHVLCVHHMGKGEREGGDSILGSTAIFAAVDTALMMKRSERYRTLSSIQRYGEDLPETVLRFDPQTRTLTLGESKEQEEEKRIAEAIIGFLKSKEEPVTEAEIDAEVEGRTTRKRKALRELVAAGKVERIGKGGKKDPFRYVLAGFMFSCSQYTSGNTGTSTEKEDLNQQEDSSYSCSRDPSESDSCSQRPEWEEIE
jgi:AAA domain